MSGGTGAASVQAHELAHDRGHPALTGGEQVVRPVRAEQVVRFAPAALTQMGADADEAREHSGAVLGLYSFALGLGQLAGAVLGGFSSDTFGMYGLIGFSILLGLIALGSVIVIRRNGHDRMAPKAVD